MHPARGTQGLAFTAALMLGSALACGGSDASPADVPSDVPADGADTVSADAPDDVPADPGTPPDPFAWGGHGVGYRLLDLADPDRGDRPLPAIVYYPADLPPVDPAVLPDGLEAPWGGEASFLPAVYAVLDAAPAPAAAPWPVLLFSHGSGGQKEIHKFLLEFLASHGWACAAVDHTGNVGFGQYEPQTLDMTVLRLQDIRFLADHVLALSTTAGDPLEGRLDAGRAAVAGHSYGGHVALALAGAAYDLDRIRADCLGPEAAPDPWTCAVADAWTTLDPVLPDPRFRAVVSLANDSSANHFGEGCQGASALAVPSLHVGGTADRTAVFEREAALCQAAAATGPAEAALLKVEGGGHLGFTDVGNEGPLDTGRVHDLVRSEVRAFLDAHVR